jgi:hypothetical protein
MYRNTYLFQQVSHNPLNKFHSNSLTIVFTKIANNSKIKIIIIIIIIIAENPCPYPPLPSQNAARFIVGMLSGGET